SSSPPDTVAVTDRLHRKSVNCNTWDSSRDFASNLLKNATPMPTPGLGLFTTPAVAESPTWWDWRGRRNPLFAACKVEVFILQSFTGIRKNWLTPTSVRLRSCIYLKRRFEKGLPPKKDVREF